MGIVPLQYKAGETAESLWLTGKEKFDIHLPATLIPGQDVTVTTESGKSFNVTSRFGLYTENNELSFLDTQVSLAPTLVRCRSVRRSVRHTFGFPFCQGLWTITERP